MQLSDDHSNESFQNIQQGHLVNGSVGIVESFKTPLEAKEHQTEIARVEENGQLVLINTTAKEVLTLEQSPSPVWRSASQQHRRKGCLSFALPME